jgi:hypothetical protein
MDLHPREQLDADALQAAVEKDDLPPPPAFGDDKRVDELEFEDVASELHPSREELVLLARLWRTAGMVVDGHESRSGNQRVVPRYKWLTYGHSLHYFYRLRLHRLATGAYGDHTQRIGPAVAT